MSMQDIVSDYVSRVNNAITVDQNEVVVLRSKFIESITKKLVSLGFFNSFELTEDKRGIRIELNLSRVTFLKRVSKPGQRTYTSSKEFPAILNGIGFNILTTSKGIKTNIECLKDNLGGEVVLQIIGKPRPKMIPATAD